MKSTGKIEHKKWVYEIILERVPPFSWFPRGYNVALQLFLMEIIGILVAAVFALPSRSIFYGSRHFSGLDLELLSLPHWPHRSQVETAVSAFGKRRD